MISAYERSHASMRAPSQVVRVRGSWTLVWLKLRAPWRCSRELFNPRQGNHRDGGGGNDSVIGAMLGSSGRTVTHHQSRVVTETSHSRAAL
jgi:hypothetical protein